jgi:hypothetical protein
MTPTVDPADVERKARQLVDHRMAAVRAHAGKVQARADREDDVVHAKREEHESWRAALAVGWTEDEMKKMGFSEPEKPRRSGRRGSERSAADGPDGPSSGSGQTPPSGGPEAPQ